MELNTEISKYSTEKLRTLVHENISRPLALDILNLDVDIKNNKDRINPNCSIYSMKELVKFYVKAYPFHVGHEIRRSINVCFSREELIHALETQDYTNIYQGILNHLKESSEPGIAGVHRAICYMMDYKLNGYLEEVKEQ